MKNGVILSYKLQFELAPPPLQIAYSNIQILVSGARKNCEKNADSTCVIVLKDITSSSSGSYLKK